MRAIARLWDFQLRVEWRAQMPLKHLLGLVVPVQRGWVKYDGVARRRISSGISALRQHQSQHKDPTRVRKFTIPISPRATAPV
jgi:hypothetical protein